MFSGRHNNDPILNPQRNWRAYQDRLKRNNVLKDRLRKTSLLVAVFLIVLGAAYGVIKGITFCISFLQKSTQSDPSIRNTEESIAKKDVRTILGDVGLVNLSEKEFTITAKGKEYQVITSIDPLLQNYLKKKLYTKTSRYIAIVISDPVSGRIVSMVGLDKVDPNKNPCVGRKFPAASIFKIVTAAAAIETCDFEENQKLAYNGQSHTLYKRQLKNKTNRYTNWVTFKEAFAKSVNPVFGKIGTHYLGKTIIEKYAYNFGFNQNIEFEIPLSTSDILVTEEPYHWAEIASGFNRKTTITAVHGALIAGAILNGGQLMEPTIIDRIVDDQNRTVYTGKKAPVQQAVSPEAAKVIQKLMNATVKFGTLNRTFRGYRKDRTLSRLSIGGKTGSIFNSSHDARIDWCVGYAREKEGEEQIVVSVIVAHEKYIGTRAGEYVRLSIKQYFKNYFAHKKSLFEKSNTLISKASSEGL